MQDNLATFSVQPSSEQSRPVPTQAPATATTPAGIAQIAPYKKRRREPAEPEFER